MIRPHLWSTLIKHHLFVVYFGLALSISLPLVRIQASTDPPVAGKEANHDAGVVSPAQENQQTQQLEPGKPIGRELAGGQSHSYQMTLATGQYVRVVVDQRGIDVTMKLVGPDGKQAATFDSEIRTQGRETLEWVAEAAGSYRVDMLAKYKNAAAGRYEIQVAELHLATDDDRTLHEAHKLNTEFLKLRRAGKYDEARTLGERVLEIRERALGSDHPDVANSVEDLAILYKSKGDYTIAESFYQRALTIKEKVLGPEHPDVHYSLNNLAILHYTRGEYAKAEEFYGRALTIGEKSLGNEHPVVALTLMNLAGLYHARGNYAKAESLYQRALAIFDKALEPEHPYIANILNNLATSYLLRSEYAKAEQHLQRALTIKEKILGREHPDVISSLNNLAYSYYDRGDYEKAEPLYQRALTIGEKALGPEHPNLARTLEHLASLYDKRGQYAMAEPLYLRALTIREKGLGLEHPLVSLSLVHLATFYRERGDYVRAEPLYHRALALAERSVGPVYSGVAGILNDLANLYRARGDYDRAEPLLERALAIKEKAYGPQDIDFARSLADFARLHAAKGDYSQAVAFLARANDVEERNFAHTLAVGSERQKLLYLARFSKGTDFTLSLQCQAAPDDPQALDLAFTTLLRRKGRGLDAMTDAISTLRRHATAQDQALIDILADTRSQLAALTLKNANAANPDTYLKRIKPLEIEVDRLEEELSSRSARFRVQRQPATLAAIQAALPAGSALVEFAYFTPMEPQTGKSRPPRYLAYLIAAQGEPRWVDLGEAAAIDHSVEGWRKALRDPNRTDVNRRARAVDEKVMRPVRSLLRGIPGEARRLLIAPDGSLNLIPFAALVDEQNRYLVERYSISYLTSGRDLLRLQTSEPSKNEPLVIANPDFGRFATIALGGGQYSGEPQTRNRMWAQSYPQQIFFQPLPGTDDEAIAIKALLPIASVLRREDATETALKQVSGPQILHIATHGFFLNYQKANEAEEDPSRDVSSGAAEFASAQANSYTIQIEVAPALETANEKVKKLKAQGVDAYILKSKVKGKRAFFRVRTGNFPTRAEANKYGADLHEKGLINQFFVARYQPPPGDLTETPSNLRLSRLAAQIKDPLLRSGLALAGANHGKSGDDDGVLTALEAGSLDLLGTKLVVLSACDTGVGEVKNGEGVQGLRRALVLAGSESQIISLWPVSDDATKDLMIPYYKALLLGEGRSEGLRQVQMRMLRGRKDRRHPFFWAAFIQSGEWANLNGQR